MQFRSALFFFSPSHLSAAQKTYFRLPSYQPLWKCQTHFFVKLQYSSVFGRAAAEAATSFGGGEKKKIVSLQKSLRFKPLRQSTNLVNKLNFHNKSCRLCCFPALGMSLKAPPLPAPPPQESFSFFRSSKLKTAQKRLSSRNQLISRNATHTFLSSPPLLPPALSLEGILSSFSLSEDHSITQAGNRKTHCSYPARKIDLLIASFFDGRPKQPCKKGPFSASDVCRRCLEACVVKRASAGHWSSWCLPPGQWRGEGTEDLGNLHPIIPPLHPPPPPSLAAFHRSRTAASFHSRETTETQEADKSETSH